MTKLERIETELKAINVRRNTGMDLADVFRMRRRELKLSQKQLAQMIGGQQKSISDYENGKCTPRYETMNKLFDILKLDVKPKQP